MYFKLQERLPEFTVRAVTMENLSFYESIFFSNEEYYRLTDGNPATRKTCEDTIDSFPPHQVYSIGISRQEEAVAFLSILNGYPDVETLYIGLLLVDEKYKRKSVGTLITKAILTTASELGFKKLKLSVQENNLSGLKFWRKMGFYEKDRCACDGFDNLSMQYDIK
jgi:ribosomal protein S18 acetylase RimI-like enzyme